MQESWDYYNHSLIPSTEPHIDCTPPKNKHAFWKNRGGYPLLARWTTDFDCGYETNWWYVIKDTPFDISELKAKRRYEINKGKKNFEIRRIVATEYSDDILEVTKKAYLSWPEKYRPSINDETFKSSLCKWDSAFVYGAFDIETGFFSGYAYLIEHEKHMDFVALRVIPEFEKRGINVAICAGILEDNAEKFDGNWYINDGARSIRHETAFQDYLEKYFGFRKAYCHIDVIYRKPFGLIIKALFPLRGLINTSTKYGSLAASVLKLEEIRRNNRSS